ncbi:LITAF-like zinc ribbon domain-containing protein [Pilobolus umbonatus]|nr:LITAF-like zinc ribbon domain-containing protein [Pilobolus umbonatus]
MKSQATPVDISRNKNTTLSWSHLLHPPKWRRRHHNKASVVTEGHHDQRIHRGSMSASCQDVIHSIHNSYADPPLHDKTSIDTRSNTPYRVDTPGQASSHFIHSLSIVNQNSPFSQSDNESVEYPSRRSYFRRKISDTGGLTMPGDSNRSVISNTERSTKSRRLKKGTRLLNNEPYLPDHQTKAYCSKCEKYLETRIRYRNGPLVWMLSFILLLCTVILCWVPFFVKYFKDVAHYCPACGNKMGTHYRMH